MHPETMELMQEQVRAIYRAATGVDLEAELDRTGRHPLEDSERPPFAEVALRFADLEAMARGIPEVARRVPPFYFRPPIDVLEDEGALVVEVAVPGIKTADVSVELSPNGLLISGVRRGTSKERCYLRAEIPHGPFTCSIPLPYAIDGEPRIEIDRGLISIRMTRAHGESPE